MEKLLKKKKMKEFNNCVIIQKMKINNNNFMQEKLKKLNKKIIIS